MSALIQFDNEQPHLIMRVNRVKKNSSPVGSYFTLYLKKTQVSRLSLGPIEIREVLLKKNESFPYRRLSTSNYNKYIDS